MPWNEKGWRTFAGCCLILVISLKRLAITVGIITTVHGLLSAHRKISLHPEECQAIHLLGSKSHMYCTAKSMLLPLCFAQSLERSIKCNIEHRLLCSNFILHLIKALLVLGFNTTYYILCSN